jgi:hypothetical protein
MTTRTGRTEAAPTADLPAVVAVRPHAEGDTTTVIRFENGAELRYRPHETTGDTETAGDTADGEGGVVTETWVSPDGDRVTRVREGDPERLALRTLGAYLSFESRSRAVFVWGEENVRTLFGT